ncbi:hypothetical protein B0H16DRAFT_1471722 [Mycena metata]|uniref:Uncharacterized protein n=1 Tax=Mycena metata TaxID=1033252 RepID=A0AAD7HQ06_9AGAR|nr:hypothetical protein B0H16DRAFT_1471722 [Mycena metata]
MQHRSRTRIRTVGHLGLVQSANKYGSRSQTIQFPQLTRIRTVGHLGLVQPRPVEGEKDESLIISTQTCLAAFRLVFGIFGTVGHLGLIQKGQTKVTVEVGNVWDGAF